MEHSYKLKVIAHLKKQLRLSKEIMNDIQWDTCLRKNIHELNFNQSDLDTDDAEETHYQQGCCDILEDAILLIEGNHHLVEKYGRYNN